MKQIGTERVRFFQCDVADTESVTAVVKDVLRWVGETGRPIGGVVAAAGVGFPGKVGYNHAVRIRLSEETSSPQRQIIDRHNNPVSLSSFDTVVKINLYGTIDLIRQLLPAMTKNKPVGTNPTISSPSDSDSGDAERGVLVLVSSVAAFDGLPGQLAYSASKGAIASLVLPLARDLAPYGIRAVAIAPGVFESNMTSMISSKFRKSLEGVMVRMFLLWIYTHGTF